MALKKIIAYTGLVSTVLLTACDNKKAEPPKAPPPVSVVLDTAKTTDAVYYDEYPATVTPLNQIDLRPQVSGFISGVYFKDGDRVRKGQLLYSIDEQLYNANYQQAVANSKVQEANANLAQKDADRYHQLEKND